MDLDSSTVKRMLNSKLSNLFLGEEEDVANSGKSEGALPSQDDDEWDDLENELILEYAQTELARTSFPSLRGVEDSQLFDLAEVTFGDEMRDLVSDLLLDSSEDLFDLRFDERDGHYEYYLQLVLINFGYGVCFVATPEEFEVEQDWIFHGAVVPPEFKGIVTLVRSQITWQDRLSGFPDRTINYRPDLISRAEATEMLVEMSSNLLLDTCDDLGLPQDASVEHVRRAVHEHLQHSYEERSPS